MHTTRLRCATRRSRRRTRASSCGSFPARTTPSSSFEIVGEDGKPQVGADRKPVTWGVELGPAAAAATAKQGVTVESFPLGTIITVTLNPLRNGKPFGALAQGGRLVRCGSEIPPGGCTVETGEVFLAARD